MDIIFSGFINKNYDGWATVSEIPFADYMYSCAESCNNAVAYNHNNRLGGKRAIIPDCNISMYFSDKEMDYESAQEKFLDNFLGAGVYEMEADYVGYSEWTIVGFELDECKLGGHDLNEILLNNIGKYVNVRVEIN